MMISDALNSHIYLVSMEITATKNIPALHICSTYEGELKNFLVDKTSLQICSTEEDESKEIIIDKCSTE